MEESKIGFLRKLSIEIDSNVRKKNFKKVRELLNEALKMSEKIEEAYLYFFKGEECGYFENNKEKQLEYYIKALNMRPDDHFFHCQLGIFYSLQNQLENAHNHFDKAFELKTDYYDSIRQKGICYYKQNMLDEAINCYDTALKLNPNDYKSLRLKGIVLMTNGDYENALTYLDKALELNVDDYISLFNKGYTLFLIGKQAAAIQVFKTILKSEPEDNHTLRMIGICFSFDEKEEEAIRFLNKAIKSDPNDHVAHRQLGVSYTTLKKYENAFEHFNKANNLQPNDYRTLYNWGAALLECGDKEGAYAKITEAYNQNPDDTKILNMIKFLTKYLEEDFEKGNISKKIIPEVDNQPQGIAEIVAVIQQVRESAEGKFENFLQSMRATKDLIISQLSPESDLADDKTFFLILKKWNSYTPALPSISSERSVGGGYFIYHNGIGTVIDPGYNFIENFIQAGCKIKDIDNIVITHAHNDHTNDFESILTLIYKYNSENNFDEEHNNYKKISLYMNAGSLIKFSGFLDLRGAKYIANLIVVSADDEYPLSEGFRIKALKAYHDEIISNKYAVGLKLVFDINGKKKTILITSDTGLYPQKLDKESKKRISDIDGTEIWKTYNLTETPNLLVAHIGSIKESEYKADIKTEQSQIFYPNHLGLIGTARVITALQPKLALVSEIGEELVGCQNDIIQTLQKIVNSLCGKDMRSVPYVMPADIPFIYNIMDETVYCPLSRSMITVDKIKYGLVDEQRFFYYSNEQQDKSTLLSREGEVAEENRSLGMGPYFRKER